eukprot:CAMPEP_0181355198 /NCGR_PEP_ID=MMETSP1106-20121128/3769_1 /TAXON_ID=81844 /ORGANISM="Mantoniella antarctica, Strain SL-175" /LENGTH=75 /DNA_ID=CAMNT_0023467917 /DNA_START=591 /DNA_END=814 /DNA_ORIENTATION=+
MRSLTVAVAVAEARAAFSVSSPSAHVSLPRFLYIARLLTTVDITWFATAPSDVTLFSAAATRLLAQHAASSENFA